MEYYVYAYLDPNKCGSYSYGNYTFEYEPFYIGKGKDDRYLYHITETSLLNDGNKLKTNKIKKIKNPIIIFVKEYMCEDDSLLLEMDLISTIGRIDMNTGPLTNLTFGGEGESGRICTSDMKHKISNSNKGKIPWNKGLTSNIDNRVKKYSETRKGQKRTDEFKSKMKIHNKQKSLSKKHLDWFKNIMNSDEMIEKRRLSIINNNSMKNENNGRWVDIDLDVLKTLYLDTEVYHTIKDIANIMGVGVKVIEKRIKLLNLTRKIKKIKRP